MKRNSFLSANLYVRIDPGLKEQAEDILSGLGITASHAIEMSYRQIVSHQGLPFEVEVPVNAPVDVSKLTEEELDAELEKGYADVLVGRTRDAKRVFEDLYTHYGISRTE